MSFERIALATVLVVAGTACRSSSTPPPAFVPAAGAPMNAAADARASEAVGNSAQTAMLIQDAAQKPPLADAEVRAEPGQPAPDFELVDLYGKMHKLSAYRGKIVVLEWFDPVCAEVQYAYGAGELREMKARQALNGVVWLAVNSAAAGEPGADPRRNREFVTKHRLRQPILLDPSGKVGQTYAAMTTPHLYVINERGLLVYSGALDNAPGGRVESLSSKANYVEMAIADLRSGHAVLKTTTRAYGCEIKYPRP